MSTLEEAISIAALAHAGQKDKLGRPYILHPLRVMLSAYHPIEKIVAVLHDVVEDTQITLPYLLGRRFSDDVLNALALLTHDKATPYHEYIEAIRTSYLASTVKLLDIADNMARLPELSKVDPEAVKRLQEKYTAAVWWLTH